jgi:hypothetical protein
MPSKSVPMFAGGLDDLTRGFAPRFGFVDFFFRSAIIACHGMAGRSVSADSIESPRFCQYTSLVKMKSPGSDQPGLHTPRKENMPVTARDYDFWGFLSINKFATTQATPRA